MQPYSLTSIGASNHQDASNINSGGSTLSWMVQPYQINSSGTLPGNTVINVGQGVQINGNTGTITLTNPTTSKVSIVLGLLPDGTYNLVIAKTGLDVYKDVF